MSTTSRGTAWTTTVQTWIVSHGWDITHRAPWMAPGSDLTANCGGALLSIECKAHRKLDLAGWIQQAEQQAATGEHPVVFAKRLGKTSAADGYVIMTGAAFARLLKDR